MGDGDPVDAVEIGGTTLIAPSVRLFLFRWALTQVTWVGPCQLGAALEMGSVTPVKPLVSFAVSAMLQSGAGSGA